MGGLVRQTAVFTLAALQLVSGFVLPETSAFEVFAANANSNASSAGSSSRWGNNLHLAVDYYPSQWDAKTYWEDDASRMRAANITHVRIGEFDWALYEPEDGKYDWTDLDRSFDLLHRHGLKVILGTPSETPPLWAVKNYDILGWDQHRRPRLFGSRHHFSFSSQDYRKLNKRVTEALARRYGSHPALSAWQLSNEYGCHSTTRDYSPHAKKAFQQWLKEKYGDIKTLNKKQGRVFWSSQFDSFESIDVPTGEVTESNPALRLDFFTFSSDQVISFAKETVDAIRKHSDRAVTTNYMGGFNDFDLYKFQHVNQLDLSTLDSYPLGNEQSQPWESDDNKAKYLRTGSPDFQSMHFEIMRTMGKDGKWGIMEQQPGPVNWASVNPSPLAGMVRLWLHEIFAHGASLANIFRWREVPFAEEQMHAGMLRYDNEEDLAFKEQQEVVAELAKMQDAGLLEAGSGNTTASKWAEDSQRGHSQIALLYDFTAPWVIEANPQGGSWDTNTFKDFTFVFFQLLSNWHSAIRRLGLDVDVVGPYSDLSKYKLVVAPTVPMIGSEVEKQLQNFNGSLIVGPRTASKESTLSIAAGLPPAAGALRDRIPMKVVRVESLPTSGSDQVVNQVDGSSYNVTAWSEWLECSRDGKKANGDSDFVFKGYRDGSPGSCKHTTEDGRNTTYVGWFAQQDAMVPLFAKAAADAGIKTVVDTTPSATDLDLGDSIRFVRHGRALYAVNYSPDQRDVKGIPAGASLVFGGVDGDAAKIAPAGVNLYKMS